MKAIEQYFPVTLFYTMLYKLLLTFESVNEILKSDLSNERYCAVLSCGTARFSIFSNKIQGISECLFLAFLRVRGLNKR